MTPEVSPGIRFRSAARSHTGLIRSNNQDSGYAGPNMLLIADGMGGHAGGDVASAIAVSRLEHLDVEHHGLEALEDLRRGILAANDVITQRVETHPELAGMGTTVTALLRAGDRFALAHIGDSRAYLLRDGELTLVTHDHTFVQLLVDEGRITPEEAETHPQRSVVMRVLGDVGSEPELDLSIREAVVGDRWLVCSDGLSGFVSFGDIQATMNEVKDLDACAERLTELALEGGGADNVTAVLGDVVEDESESRHEAVGSVAINPHYINGAPGTEDLPTEAVPVTPGAGIAASPPAPEKAESSPEDTQDLSAQPAATGPGDTLELDTEAGTVAPVGTANGADDAKAVDTKAVETTGAQARDREDAEEWGAPQPRKRRRFLTWIVLLVVLLLVAGGAFAAWTYIQSQFYVASDQESVAIYRGVSQDLGSISLSRVDERTDVALEDLSPYSRQRVEETIPAGSEAEAQRIVTNLREEAQANREERGIQPGASNSTQATQDPVPSPSAEQPANNQDSR